MARKKKSEETIEDLCEALVLSKEETVIHEGLLSSGSTLVNLACTGKAEGAFYKGHSYSLVGDSDSGKSFLSLTCFAEATINPLFQDYRLILNNPENSVKMDLSRFFGKKMEDKLEREYSSTVEEFYYHVDTCCEEGTPFIYVLDSMDSLSANEEVENFQTSKLAHSEGKGGPGSYGTAKAKANSQGLRLLMDPLRKSGSILIIISQTRDNIGFGAKFNPRVRSGGKAMKFFATLEIWTSVKEQLKKTVKGKARQLGILAQVQIKKNRSTGRHRVVEMPIYHSSGIDDMGSCVDWLIEEDFWKETKGSILAPQFDHVGSKDRLIQNIESEGLENKLKSLVQSHWDEIEEACRVERKNKYE